MKKIIALVLALLVAMSMTAAFAADLGNDGVTEPGVNESNSTTLDIYKSLVIENDLKEAITVAYPAITYSYTIANADSSVADGAILDGKSVTDETPVTSAVKNGVNDAVTIGTGTIAIATGTVQLNANINGASNAQEIVREKLTVTVTPTSFNNYGPGIYRYKLTDTTAESALVAAGIVRGSNFDKEYYLDVYIGWDNYQSETRALQVNGYVLLSENTTKIDAPSNAAANNKESGFDEVTVTTEGKLGAPADLATNDVYHTYNITLTKKVTGAMGDTSHEFPFTVTATNEGLQYILRETEANANGTTLNATSSVASSITLSHDDVATLIGLSPKATVVYNETNDTDSVYKTTAKAGSTDLEVTYSTGSNANGVVKDGTVTTASLNVTSDYNSGATAANTAIYTADENNAAVTYTNDLPTISPTGVVLRFAPYIAMLAGGVLLLVLARKRRTNKDED